MEQRTFTDPQKTPFMSNEQGARRLEVVQSSFGVPEGNRKPLPLKNDSQTYILVHLTNQLHQFPSCNEPGFRILGAFPTEASLVRFTKLNYPIEREENQVCHLWKIISHTLVPICDSDTNQMDAMYLKIASSERLKFYQEAIVEAKNEFDNLVEHKKADTTGKSLFAREYALRTNLQKQHENNQSQPQNELSDSYLLTSSQRVSGQTYAVIILIRDLRTEVIQLQKIAEPCFVVLAVFHALEDAIFYAKYTAAKHYPLCTIDVVDMYEWIFPQQFNSDQAQEIYGDKRLDDLMVGKKVREQAVKTMKEQQAQISVPITTLNTQNKSNEEATEQTIASHFEISNDNNDSID